MINPTNAVLFDALPVCPKNEPPCPVFGECGGCAYQELNYQDQLRIKENGLKKLFKERLLVDDRVFRPIVASPKPYHYRNRLDLKLKKTRAGEIFIGFTPVSGRGVIPVETCYIAEEKIAAFIPALKEEAIGKLPAKYKNANLTVRCGQDGRVRWGGIGRRSCRLAAQDYFWIDLGGHRIFYSLDTFFQANASILPELFKILHGLDMIGKQTVLFDLYGGVGLFGIGLCDRVRKVILVEENKASLELARHNVAFNHIRNMDVREGKVEDVCPGLLEEHAKSDKVIIVDPPRAGLSKPARTFLLEATDAAGVIYLSCNPESLVRDLAFLTQKDWRIDRVVPLDFFPQTRHLETLAVLYRN